MKTVVLDDDPTGTQSASDVSVLLEWDADEIRDVLAADDSVYILTNTRALDEGEVVALLQQVREQALEAGRRLGEEILFVLRGDSTLRGHVFAETEVFAQGEGTVVFVPAFPDGGRITREGRHLVRLDGAFVPAHETEYAADPVFPFGTSLLAEYVAERSSRRPHLVALGALRAGRAVDEIRAAAGGVVLFDCETNADIALIAEAVAAAHDEGMAVTVRSGSPLAAELAGVASTALLPRPLRDEAVPTLLVCGSHTEGATRQLAPLTQTFGAPAVIATEAALCAPGAAGRAVGEELRERAAAAGFAAVMSERARRAEHDTLAHGAKVMAALTTAVRASATAVSAVVSKGGITSAEVARVGLGARRARVRGQVLPGISVWDLTAFDGREIMYIVVPGNVGDERTLVDVLAALGLASDAPAPTPLMRGIDHTAVAVRDADVAMRYYIDELGLELIGDELAEDPGVRLVYLAAGPDVIQLVSPFRPGPVQEWLDEHGEGLHHFCFRVDSIPEVLAAVPGQEERPIFRGGRRRRACFLGGTPEGVQIEMTETDPIEE